MKQNSKTLAKFAATILMALFLLGACGDTVPLAVSPSTSGLTATITASTPVSSIVSIIVTATTPVTPATNTTPVKPTTGNTPVKPLTINALQASSVSVVLVGEITYNQRATANSPRAAWPELKYADGVGLSAPTKSIRLKLDETQLNELYSSGQVARLLVKGQRIGVNTPSEEALQVSFMEPMGFESKHQVGTLKYQAGTTNPELLFSPEGFKASPTWHLLVNTALINQLGDLTSLNGKRVMLNTEQIKKQADTLYVSYIGLLGKGPILMAKADSLGTYVADAPGPTNTIGTNSSGFCLQDKVSGQTFYLILPEGINFDPTDTSSLTFKGEKLVSENGQDLGGLLFVASIISGT